MYMPTPWILNNVLLIQSRGDISSLFPIEKEVFQEVRDTTPSTARHYLEISAIPKAYMSFHKTP